MERSTFLAGVFKPASTVSSILPTVLPYQAARQKEPTEMKGLSQGGLPHERPGYRMTKPRQRSFDHSSSKVETLAAEFAALRPAEKKELLRKDHRHGIGLADRGDHDPVKAP